MPSFVQIKLSAVQIYQKRKPFTLGKYKTCIQSGSLDKTHNISAEVHHFENKTLTVTKISRYTKIRYTDYTVIHRYSTLIKTQNLKSRYMLALA